MILIHRYLNNLTNLMLFIISYHKRLAATANISYNCSLFAPLNSLNLLFKLFWNNMKLGILVTLNLSAKEPALSISTLINVTPLTSASF